MDKTRMRRYVLAGLVLALAFAGGALLAWLGANGRLSYTEPRGNPSLSGGEVAAMPVQARQPLKDFTFADEKGRVLTVADFRGKVVLVNLWATWCPPCVAEMPALDGLQKRMGGDGFQVVAVSLDRGGAAVVRRWYEKAGLAALSIHTADAGQFVGALLPTSWLIDGQGRVAWMGNGIRDWEGAEAQAAIKAVMGERVN